jgi:serine phosphatase RsbU (regulator of sigma subunit)
MAARILRAGGSSSIVAKQSWCPDVLTGRVDVAVLAILRAYTDGITEAESRQHEPSGPQSLEALLESCSGKSPKQIINAILEHVSAFAKGQLRRDDVTLLVIRVEAGCDDLAVSAQPVG